MDDLILLRLLTFRQVAKSLGVTERTVYSYVVSGELPAIRLGRLRRIHPDDLASFVEKKRKVNHVR